MKKEEKEQDKKLKKKSKNPYIDFEPSDRFQAKGNDVQENLEEALSISARRKLAQRMIRISRKMAVARKKARARFAPSANLKRRAQKMARSIMRKRFAGKRGQDYGKLGMADKIAMDKMVDKQKPVIRKMVKRLLPSIKRAEAIRLSKFKTGSDDKNDKRHKKKFHGSRI